VDRVTAKDGTAIALDRLGEGLPVILVCGGSTDRMVNTPLAAPLARRFTVFNSVSTIAARPVPRNGGTPAGGSSAAGWLRTAGARHGVWRNVQTVSSTGYAACRDAADDHAAAGLQHSPCVTRPPPAGSFPRGFTSMGSPTGG
jgi:hypothetical protein